MEKLNINQWAAEDRPREKMMQKGAEALSDAELLAILIGSGNTEETAVTLMQRILAACGNDLNRLGKWEVRDFSRFKGMGPAKSITVMASLELGKRRKLQERSGRTAHPLFRRHLRAVPSPALRPCHRRILGTAYEPRRQSDRQGTHQPRRHRPDYRRRAQHPARSPAATRHTDSPYPQPSLRQPAPQ